MPKPAGADTNVNADPWFRRSASRGRAINPRRPRGTWSLDSSSGIATTTSPQGRSLTLTGARDRVGGNDPDAPSPRASGGRHHGTPPPPQLRPVVLGQRPRIGMPDRMRLAHEHPDRAGARLLDAVLDRPDRRGQAEPAVAGAGAAGVLRRHPSTVGESEGDGPAPRRGRARCRWFRPGDSFVDLPVLDAEGYPVHRRGVTVAEPAPALVGFPVDHIAGRCPTRRLPLRRSRIAAAFTTPSVLPWGGWGRVG